MVFKQRLLDERRALAHLLYQERRYSLGKIASRLNMAKSSVWRIVHGDGEKNYRQRKSGRPELLSARDKRSLQRAIAKLRGKNRNFTVMDVVRESGIEQETAHYRTFVRAVKKLGFGFRVSRRKGVLTAKDLRERLLFARTMRTRREDYWTKDVAFHLDGVSFVFKSNPMSDAATPNARIWRKPCEGLNVTTKGSKGLAGGKRLHFIVAISFGKGVILAEPYEKMNAEFFAQFVRRHFAILFEVAGKGEGDDKIFVMDNDPSQTSAKAREVFNELGFTMQKIPPRSPDLNPIENVFHLVRKRMKKQLRESNICHQTFQEFTETVQYNIWSTSREVIDKTIASMAKRLEQIIKGKGRRTKY